MLSPKQQEIRDREIRIMGVARGILLSRGYYGLTMDRVAEESQCPKGTMYQRFGCKEDIVLALATQCLEGRLSMMRRGAAFSGRSRERVLAVGEAVSLYSRLNAADSRILHTAMGPIREKGSPERVAAIVAVENEAIETILGPLRDGVAQGDLVLEGESTLEEMAFAFWSLVDGSYTLIESGVPQRTLGLIHPFYTIYRVFNILADGYNWRPLFAEQDWEETLAEVRRAAFPEEAQELYGEGQWYGDAG
jgi:AcrR family transcriptional regulator